MFTSARDVTCISHNTCLRRSQCWPILGPASATHLYTSATIPVYVGQSCGLCQPQHLFTLANTGTCIGHITCIFMSATIPVYVSQSCDLHRPQYVPTSANTGTCVSHIIVPATGQWHSRIPGVLGIRPDQHSVMALCSIFFK